jgi:hypothetical protein
MPLCSAAARGSGRSAEESLSVLRRAAAHGGAFKNVSLKYTQQSAYRQYACSLYTARCFSPSSFAMIASAHVSYTPTLAKAKRLHVGRHKVLPDMSQRWRNSTAVVFLKRETACLRSKAVCNDSESDKASGKPSRVARASRVSNEIINEWDFPLLV